MKIAVCLAGLVLALSAAITYLTGDLGFVMVLPSLAAIALWCRWRGFHTAAAMVGGALVALPVTCLIIAALQYPMVLARMPLQDHLMLRLDGALGLDWAAMYAWVYAHPVVRDVLFWSYDTTFLGLTLLTLILAWYDRERLREMLTANFVVGVTVILVFGLMPTIGPAASLGLPDHYKVGLLEAVDHLTRLRAGTGTFQDALLGLVFFPSYHAVGLAMTAFGAGALPRWARYPIYAWCVVVLVSVCPIGGHYAMDVLAGLAMSWAWIYRAKFVALLTPARLFTPSAS